MPLVSRVRPKVGDIIEIGTSRGLAYAQFTHQHKEPPTYGSLLRVFPGFYAERPAGFSDTPRLVPMFSTFFPLGAACNRKLVTIVATEPIAPRNRDFPTFRSANSDDGPWHLWNGKRKWQVSKLSPEQLRDYPPLCVWNDTLLIERIEQDWSHEHHRAPLRPRVGV